MANTWRDYLAGYQYPTLSTIQEEFFDQYMPAAYKAVLEPMRQKAPRNLYRWASNQYPEYQTRYLAELGTGQIDPGTSFYGWLTNQNGSFDPTADWQNQSPYERGERPGAFSGRTRWVL